LLEILGGERKVALCREMTKRYEEIFRGTLDELDYWVSQREILGEITVVIEGAQLSEVAARTPEEIAAQVALRESTGMERREAVTAVAEQFRLRKREVFDALVASKMEQ
jgi:16S rRNA (cytidine1402-2'-O)-methyltransferase